MSTQSADVSGYARHTSFAHESPNRLNDKTVHQLLYCYVNLRLITRYKTRRTRYPLVLILMAATFEASKMSGSNEDEQGAGRGKRMAVGVLE
jgi:hypothetical protein